MDDLVPLDEACKYATDYVKKRITKSSISYLIQYGKITRHDDASSGSILVSRAELKAYYDAAFIAKKDNWIKQLGPDLNWHLSFDNLREQDTTKHVHRLHPYKGKYIPQLVEYFLDGHVDEFKKQPFFKPGDIIIDPFMGSGTTLVQCGELGLHAIGVDISAYNCMIVQAKMERYDVLPMEQKLWKIFNDARTALSTTGGLSLLATLKASIHEFNKKVFTTAGVKRKIALKEINEDQYGNEKLAEFFQENKEIIGKLQELETKHKNAGPKGFIETWFNAEIRREFNTYLDLVEKEPDVNLKNLLKIIISRTARACRSTKHFDLATLKEPQLLPYYCFKHKKICAPIESSILRFKAYIKDTIARIKAYAALRRPVEFAVINGDSRTVDVIDEVKRLNPGFGSLVETRLIDGIFTSPPYVGQINYHEQHAYAYEMFGITRRDEKEIGPLFKGESMSAKEDYIAGISNALKNICKFVKKDGDVFIVANDKYNLYPTIARRNKLHVVEQFKRPVLNRTERDRQPYAEIIFHLKKASDVDGLEQPKERERSTKTTRFQPERTNQTKLF